jgi:hypothetical protein
MGESRSDLLIWLNSLLQLNLTKIECVRSTLSGTLKLDAELPGYSPINRTLGTGSVYCQVIDSIYGMRCYCAVLGREWNKS